MRTSKPNHRSGPLPGGTTGIESGDFFMEFRPDKVVVSAKSSDDHYTLHLGDVSGVLDFHRTWADSNGRSCHQTIFAITHANLALLLKELAPIATGILRLVRPLRLGWLHHRHIGIIREPITDADLSAVTKKHPRRNRLVIDEEILPAKILTPLYLEEVWDFPDGPFSLFYNGRRIGFGMKVTDQLGRARLFWVKLRDLSRFSRQMQDELSKVALRYAIPPDKYTDHLRNR